MKNKRNYLKESGITLIALVVTIVVLLILAGVSINALFGNSGIIKKAQNAQNTMIKTAENDLKGINELANWIDNQVNGTAGESITSGDNYTVTFCNYDGTELKKVEVAKGEEATYGTTPTRTADASYTYTFSKWTTTKDGYIEADLTNVQSDMTVYALYNTEKVCFVAGTKVLSENGLINIEDIKVGMNVYSYNEKTNQAELNEVKNTFINYVDYDMCKVYIENEVIESTNKHPYYVKGKGWTEARYLQIGDILITSENMEVEIKNIEIEKHTGNELKEVYNMEVNNNHNYFVGDNKVLVHNSSYGLPSSVTSKAYIEGGRHYDSFAGALDAAKDGDTIYLQDDCDLGVITACGTSSESDNNINISGITIELNGRTLTINSGNNVHLSNVTISNGGSTVSSIIISQGATMVIDQNTTIANTVTIINQN